MDLKPSILRVLFVIRRKPELYLGHADDPAKQLEVLGALIMGYTLCLHQHQLGNDDLATIAQLEEFMRTEASVAGPPLLAILAASADADQAWTRVWSLIEAFAAARAFEF